MPRYPHELRREGLFSSAWELKGTVLSGRFQPPRGDRPGVYQSLTLRLEYKVVGRRGRVQFQSPFLSRDGDRIQGEVRLGHAQRQVQISSKGTGSEGVVMPVVTAGLIRRRSLLMAPHGVAVVSVVRKGVHFDVDIPAGTFSPGERGDHSARGKARLYEAAVVMLLAAKIEQENRRRSAVAGAAGAAAAGAAAGATARAAKRRREADGPDT